MSFSLLQLRDISLYFPHKICFENFDTTVFATQHIALIGDNGSGKSTLLKIIAGLITPTEGSIIDKKNCSLHMCRNC